MSALKMKFLQGKSGDKYNYPVTKSDGVFLDDQGNKTLKGFIDNDLKTLSWLPSKSIEGKHLKNASVSRDNIGTGAISETKIADEAVTNRKIQKYDANKSGSGIQTDRIADGAITDAKISVGSISGNKIKDGAITKEKIFYNAFNLDFIATSDTISTWTSVTTDSDWIDLSEYHYFILGAISKENGRVLATTFVPVCAPVVKTVSVGDNPPSTGNITIWDCWETEYREDSNSGNYHAHLQLRNNNGTLEGRIFIAKGNWCLAGLWGF